MYTYAVWSVAVDKQKQTEKWKKKSELSFSDIFSFCSAQLIAQSHPDGRVG